MNLLTGIVIALVTIIITNLPSSFVAANNTNTTQSINDANNINMAAPIIQMVGHGLGNPVVPQPTFAGVNVQLNANGMGPDGVAIRFQHGYNEAAAVSSMQSLIIQMLAAMNTLANDAMLPYVPIHVNGVTQNITRGDFPLVQRTIVILAPVIAHIQTGGVTRRGLYYFYANVLGKKKADSSFAKDFNKIFSMMSLPTKAANINDESDTYIGGDAMFDVVYDDGTTKRIDFSQGIIEVGDEAVCAQLKLNNVVDIIPVAGSCDSIKNIIVAEKLSIARPLFSHGFHKRVDALILCGKGFSSKNSRTWLYTLRTKLNIDEKNCILICDYGPYGYGVGCSYGKNDFPGLEKCKTRLSIAGMQTSILDNFATTIKRVKADPDKKFGKNDIKMFKHLLKSETKFYNKIGDERWTELMDMYEGGFKFDIDALIMEYDHLFDVLARVVAGGERTLL